MIRNRALLLACFAALATPVAFSQPNMPAPPTAGAPAPPPQRGPKDDTMGRKGGPEAGGMHIVPPGTWWKNPTVVTALALTADQQKKLDDLFLQSRISLIHLHASLEEEQLKLEPLLSANPPDQTKSLAEISKIADLRADLEKANAKMLLSLRGVLTADQWTKLQAEQHTRRDGPAQAREPKAQRDQARRGGPGGQGGPQGPPPPAGPPNE